MHPLLLTVYALFSLALAGSFGFQPVRQAIARSRVVATFGAGGGRIEVRRVLGAAPLATLRPHPPRGGPTTR